jgi:hypothetical protein
MFVLHTLSRTRRGFNGEFDGFAYRWLARAKFFVARATTPSPGSAAGGNGNETG